MLKWWSDRQHRREKAQALYDLTAVSSRRPALFTDYRIPDSFDGRFESLLLHAFLVFRRLKAMPDGAARAQDYFNAVFREVETAVREVGVGDLGVGKHVKRMMTACQGRTLVYDHALNQNDDASLVAALGRNVYGTTPQIAPSIVEALASHVRSQDDMLAGLPDQDIAAARFSFAELPQAPCVKDSKEWQNAA